MFSYKYVVNCIFFSYKRCAKVHICFYICELIYINNDKKMAKSNLLQEFRTFAMKGNVIDMAVGVIIGGAFGKIVSSIVADIIMPPIGLLVGGVNFTDLKWVMKPAELGSQGEELAAAVTMNYGAFLQATFDFLIIAFSVFLFIKLINNLSKKKEEEKAVAPPPPPAPTKEEVLLTEIRDLLKEKK